MTKMVEVTFNGVKYSRPVLTTSDTLEFGWKIAPRLSSFITAIGFKVANFEGEDSRSMSEVFYKVFDLEVGHWLVNKLILDFDRPLCVNGLALTTDEEVDEHFGGQFLKLLTVAFLLSVQMLGEREAFVKNLNVSTQKIVSSLTQSLKTFMETQMEFFKIYEEQNKTSNLKRKPSNK